MNYTSPCTRPRGGEKDRPWFCTPSQVPGQCLVLCGCAQSIHSTPVLKDRWCSEGEAPFLANGHPTPSHGVLHFRRKERERMHNKCIVTLSCIFIFMCIKMMFHSTMNCIRVSGVSSFLSSACTMTKITHRLLTKSICS